MKMSKKVLSVLLSVLMIALTASCLSVCFTVSAVEVGDTIQFGTYPQTKVNETTALKNAADAATWRSYDYYIGTGSYDGNMYSSDFMKFADFFLNGVKYRAVVFTEYRPIETHRTPSEFYSRQRSNGYELNKTYFFKYEPLTWRVLDPSSGFILCVNAIDSQAYQNIIWKNSADGESYQGIDSTVYTNNYAESSIRSWLNDDFYLTAFNATQKSKIKSTTINNNAWSSAWTQYDTISTTDWIFLPSFRDLDGSSSSYGLPTNSEKRASGTDYAECQGIEVMNGFSSWLLRTAGSGSNSVCYVNYDGWVNSATGVDDTYCGIRPACCLSDLNSDTSVSNDLFSKIKCTVQCAAYPANGGTVTGGGTFTQGTTATLTATPNEGWHFVGWYVGDTLYSSLSSTLRFTVEDDISLTARFAPGDTPLWLYATQTRTEITYRGGTVDGAGYYSADSQVTINAVPDEGYYFDGWYGVHPVDFSLTTKKYSNATETITLTGSLELAALFKKVRYTVKVTPDPANGGTVTGGGTFEAGASTKLVATPNEGWHFVGFIDETGVRWGNVSPTFAVTENMTLTAQFVNVAAMQTIKNSTDTLNDGDWYFDKDALIAAFAEGFHLTTEEASAMLADAAIAKYDPESGIVVYMDASGDIDGATVALPDGGELYALYKAGIKQYHAPAEPENVCPWCGGQHEGFFQKIIGFFHNIFAKIFGAKY